MRMEIRELLVSQVPEVQSRVYEPSVPDKDTVKPYLVLREGSQDAGDPYSNFATVMELWPYVRRTTFQQVDALAQRVVNVLHRRRFDGLDGEPFYIEYLGTSGPDMVDEEWDGITRGLRFQVYSLAWLSGQTMEPDPVGAMQGWTSGRFPELQTDPVSWQPTDNQPALYWRLVTVTSVEPTAWGSWVDARLHGHLLAPAVLGRNAWVKRVTQQLPLDRRVYLPDGSPMTFLSVSADSTADPFRYGQIQLMTRFGIIGELPEEPEFGTIGVGTEDGAGGVVT